MNNATSFKTSLPLRIAIKGSISMGSRYMYFLLCKFSPIFGSSWLLFGPPWPSPGLPGLGVDSLDPQKSGFDPKIN